MATGLSICREWLDHLASLHRESADPGRMAKTIIDTCRPTLDRSDLAILTAELEDQIAGLRFRIVSSDRISAHNWRLAVIQAAVRALKAVEEMR